MTWTVVTFPYGSTLTNTKMTNMYNNFAALAGAHSGAPKFKKASLDNDSVDFASIIDSTITDGTLTMVGVGATQLIPKGAVLLACTAGAVMVQTYVNAAWRDNWGLSATLNFSAFAVTDGTNNRTRGVGAGTNTIKYRRIYQ